MKSSKKKHTVTLVLEERKYDDCTGGCDYKVSVLRADGEVVPVRLNYSDAPDSRCTLREIEGNAILRVAKVAV